MSVTRKGIIRKYGAKESRHLLNCITGGFRGFRWSNPTLLPKVAHTFERYSFRLCGFPGCGIIVSGLTKRLIKGHTTAPPSHRCPGTVHPLPGEPIVRW
jgi:hypothetical protein